jgi:hypothetical protein
LRDNQANSNSRMGRIMMPIMPIVLIVGLLFLSVAVNPFHKRAQTEQFEQTTPGIPQREKLQKFATIMLVVGIVIVLTAFMTVLVYVPLE